MASLDDRIPVESRAPEAVEVTVTLMAMGVSVVPAVMVPPFHVHVTFCPTTVHVHVGLFVAVLGVRPAGNVTVNLGALVSLGPLPDTVG